MNMCPPYKRKVPPELCLKGQLFFIWSNQSSHQVAKEKIRLLGGKVDTFFSSGITTVLVEDTILASTAFHHFDSKRASFLSLNFGGSLPLNHALPSTSSALNLLATSQNGLVRILCYSRQWGIPILGLAYFLTYIDPIVKSVRQKKPIPVSTPNQLNGYFIKFESFRTNFRPCYKMFNHDPERLMPLRKSNLLINSETCNLFLDKPLGPLQLNYNHMDTSEKQTYRLKEPKQLPMKVADKKVLNKLKPKEDNNYCECCRTHFSDLSLHIRSSNHQRFVTNGRNYDNVNGIIKMLPKEIKFLDKNRRMPQPLDFTLSNSESYNLSTHNLSLDLSAPLNLHVDKPVTTMVQPDLDHLSVPLDLNTRQPSLNQAAAPAPENVVKQPQNLTKTSVSRTNHQPPNNAPASNDQNIPPPIITETSMGTFCDIGGERILIKSEPKDSIEPSNPDIANLLPDDADNDIDPLDRNNAAALAQMCLNNFESYFDCLDAEIDDIILDDNIFDLDDPKEKSGNDAAENVEGLITNDITAGPSLDSGISTCSKIQSSTTMPTQLNTAFDPKDVVIKNEPVNFDEAFRSCQASAKPLLSPAKALTFLDDSAKSQPNESLKNDGMDTFLEKTQASAGPSGLGAISNQPTEQMFSDDSSDEENDGVFIGEVLDIITNNSDNEGKGEKEPLLNSVSSSKPPSVLPSDEFINVVDDFSPAPTAISHASVSNPTPRSSSTTSLYDCPPSIQRIEDNALMDRMRGSVSPQRPRRMTVDMNRFSSPNTLMDHDPLTPRRDETQCERLQVSNPAAMFQSLPSLSPVNRRDRSDANIRSISSFPTPSPTPARMEPSPLRQSEPDLQSPSRLPTMANIDFQKDMLPHENIDMSYFPPNVSIPSSIYSQMKKLPYKKSMAAFHSINSTSPYKQFQSQGDGLPHDIFDFHNSGSYQQGLVPTLRRASDNFPRMEYPLPAHLMSQAGYNFQNRFPTQPMIGTMGMPETPPREPEINFHSISALSLQASRMPYIKQEFDSNYPCANVMPRSKQCYRGDVDFHSVDTFTHPFMTSQFPNVPQMISRRSDSVEKSIHSSHDYHSVNALSEHSPPETTCYRRYSQHSPDNLPQQTTVMPSNVENRHFKKTSLLMHHSSNNAQTDSSIKKDATHHSRSETDAAIFAQADTPVAPKFRKLYHKKLTDLATNACLDTQTKSLNLSANESTGPQTYRPKDSVANKQPHNWQSERISQPEGAVQHSQMSKLANVLNTQENMSRQHKRHFSQSSEKELSGEKSNARMSTLPPDKISEKAPLQYNSHNSQVLENQRHSASLNSTERTSIEPKSDFVHRTLSEKAPELSRQHKRPHSQSSDTGLSCSLLERKIKNRKLDTESNIHIEEKTLDKFSRSLDKCKSVASETVSKRQRVVVKPVNSLAEETVYVNKKVFKKKFPPHKLREVPELWAVNILPGDTVKLKFRRIQSKSIERIRSDGHKSVAIKV